MSQEATLQNVWVCPKCLVKNQKPKLDCACGLLINQDDLSEYSGDITAQGLYKEIKNYSFIAADRKVFILSCYLIKRFPSSSEAQELKLTIDINSSDTTEKFLNLLDSYYPKNNVTCGKCGTTNVYSDQTQKCITCGDWLYQYMASTKAVPSEEDIAVSDYDPSAIHCPKCRSTQVTAQKQGFGLGKAVVGGVLTGGVGILGGFI